jgi:hypothetical protein
VTNARIRACAHPVEHQRLLLPQILEELSGIGTSITRSSSNMFSYGKSIPVPGPEHIKISIHLIRGS